MSRIFITGASGFIGGAIAKRLSANHELIALSRSDASDEKIRACGAEPVRGALNSLAPELLAGCDVVIHCAAWVAAWGSRDDYWRANVEGTDSVLDAAHAAGARRFIHISTEAVLWHGQHLRDVDETHPYPESTPFLYSETKAEAERRVVAANREGEFETIVLRPRLVWGPGDTTLVPEAREMVAKGAFSWIDGGRARTSTTHVSNLAHGVELALDRGRGGEIYFLTDGETTDFRTFLTAMLGAHGVELPNRSVPSWLARPAATAIETLWSLLSLKGAPPLTRHAVGLLYCDCVLNDAKARSELDYRPILSVADGLEDLRRVRSAAVWAPPTRASRMI